MVKVNNSILNERLVVRIFLIKPPRLRGIEVSPLKKIPRILVLSLALAMKKL